MKLEEYRDNTEPCYDRKEKKTTDKGWYRVEGITNHRIQSIGKRTKFELKVHWEGYEEKTWEGFNGFVKDTTPMVERYLIRSLLVPLSEAKQEHK